MIKVTTRYLASNFILPFAIGFVFFVAFLITFYMFRIISLIVNKGVEFTTVLGIVSDLSVSFFPMATPLAAFFATIYTLNKLSEDSEIIALRSFGYKKFQIYRPFLILSLMIGLTIYALNSIYIPKANASFRYSILRLNSSGMLTSIKEGQFFTDIPNVTLFAEDVTEDGEKFKDVFLHARSSNNEQRVIFAKSGALEKIYEKDMGAPSLRLNLYDGNIVRFNESGKEIEKILFENYDFPIFNANSTARTLDKDTMKTNKELYATIQEKKRSHEALLQNPNAPDFESLRKNSHKNVVKSEIEFFTRHVSVFQIVFFVLLAFSLGIKKGRGETANNSVRAIVILLGYYGLYFFLISLAQRGAISSLLACLLPVGILFGFSLYYFRKLDWAS